MSSYSVSQTTLEQIFQGFADVSFNDKATKFEKIKIEKEGAQEQ